jgi:conjugal transfer pilus assembly protein TraK
MSKASPSAPLLASKGRWSSAGAALATVLASLAWPGAAHALQVLDGQEGRKHVVRIPARELTRIGIEGGRLQSFRYKVDELEVQQDKEAGAVFIQPRVSDKQISVFVISASGATHELILQPVDTLPLESIVIKDPLGRRNPAARGERNIVEKASSGDQAITRLVRVMAGAESDPGEFRSERLNVPVALWAEALFVLRERTSVRGLVGETFTLSNVSTKVLRLAEQEFFRSGVVAVSIEQHIVRPGETTSVYVVSNASED